jgi:hypothetical protein
MSLECVIGLSCLVSALFGYAICYFIQNTNWDLHMFYLKMLFKRK